MEVAGFHRPWHYSTQEILPSLETPTNEAERTLDLPRQWSQKPLVVNGVVVGPFEEEEEGTDIASDVVKIEGEDPAIPGYYLRSVDTGNPRHRHDSPISVQ